METLPKKRMLMVAVQMLESTFLMMIHEIMINALMLRLLMLVISLLI
jgi:hypothetical protein